MRAIVSICASAVAVAALLGLVGASRISEAQVNARLDLLRPDTFFVTPDDGSLFTSSKALSASLAQVQRLQGVTGATIVGRVDRSPSGTVSLASSPTNSSHQPVASAAVFAVGPRPADTLGRRAAAGREFDWGHMRRDDPVAVLGTQVANDLGLGSLRARPSVFVDGMAYEVIGVAGGYTQSPELNSAVLIPFTTARQRYGAASIKDQRMVVKTDRARLAALSRLVPYAIRPAEVDTLQVATSSDPANLRADLAKRLKSLVALVTLVTMVFGMLVIGATTLASVTERKVEIGLRRAVGARTRDIFGLIVMESAFLGVIGGLVGILVSGVGLASVAALSRVPFPIAPLEVFAAAGIGLVVGLLAGLWPAQAAVRIDPSEALRS